jgi:PAS domain S-box-containing protein
MQSESNRYEFEALFNNAAIGIIIVDSVGTILLVNQFALQQFGYQDNEIIGQKIEKLIPQRFKAKHETHRDRYHNHNPHSRPMGTGLDLYAAKKNGTEFPVEVSLSTYTTPEGRFTIAFVSDITIRKEEKVKERTLSLEEALEKEKELNELKSRFVSMASHEFRTPLSTILSSAYLVSKYVESEEQPKRDKHIQRIISSVNMLTDILNDFLSVGKIEEGKIQVRIFDVDIPETVSSLLNELFHILKKGQKISYKHDGSNIALIDAALLKHILMNLVSNAIKFSPEDSIISVTTAVTQSEFILSVKDEGVGISEEDQQHLFQRFFRGANVTNIQGTGLGLHIVSKYAELMNGQITYETALNKGTKFIITFKNNHTI